MRVSWNTILGAAVLWACAAQDGAAAGFEWFAAGDLATIFEDGYHSPAPLREIRVFGIRGETVSAQAVIAARESLPRVTVEPAPVANASGGARVSVAWNFVRSVPVPLNTPATPKDRLTRAAPARFPEWLSEERAMAVPAGGYQPVWLNFSIPRDAAPGTYTGSVALVAGSARASLPVAVKVYPFEMPVERHLMVTNWFTTGQFAKFHETGEPYSDRFFQVLRNYAGNLADHRQNVFRVELSSVIATRGDSGKLTFDFSRFDRWAEAFWATGRMDRLETGFVARFGEQGHSDTRILLRDFSASEASSGHRVTVPGREYLAQFLPVFEKHLKEKGWLEKTLFHIADEPSSWNLASWREASDFIRRAAPGLRRIDAIETVGFDGALEVWVPKLNHFHTWMEFYQQAQRQGNELWFYTCLHPRGVYPNRFIDFPPIKTRVLHWMNYRFGATGYLHWGLNHWTANPFEDLGEARLPPGDAWVVYPKRDGLLNSPRWETLRNGIQDYEYLWLLERKLAAVKSRAGAALAWLDPGRRGVEIAARVVQEMDDYTTDPAVLYAAKEQILQEMLDLDQGPPAVVQTEPREGSRLLYGPISVLVRGWTEPGATVTMGTKQVPVAADGTFVNSVEVNPKRTSISVRVKTAGGEKTITRGFRIVE